MVHLAAGSAAAVDAWFNDPAAHVSAHYLVKKTGDIHQYVREEDTAFHAGIVVAPTWPEIKPRVNPNFYTLGIEHEGVVGDIWPEAQVQASAALIQELGARWSIPLDLAHVVGHHMIRASKPCPGGYGTPERLLAAVAALGPVPEDGSGEKATVGASPLRMRSQPATSSSILRVLPPGTAVDVLQRVPGEVVRGNGQWARLAAGYVWTGGLRASLL